MGVFLSELVVKRHFMTNILPLKTLIIYILDVFYRR